MKYCTLVLICTGIYLTGNAQVYQMPAETQPHEGTWLQWPHQFEYGVGYRNSLDATWVAMTEALIQSEKVHIIAYNANQQTRITNLLADAGINLDNIDFKIFPTNDVWVRDNGPIFVRNSEGDLLIEDWGFNGWGGKFNSDLCNPIPTSVGNAIGVAVLDLNSILTIEGGAYELDGNGVMLSCKSSTLSQSPANSVRNPGITQSEAEVALAQYLGVTKFIWLDGFTGTEDITDAHIDGFAKFANDNKLVTMSNEDLIYWGLSAGDVSTLFAASDVNNVEYNKVFLPLTQNDVSNTFGDNLGYKGSYCNYYIGNTVVLVPNYNDPNDDAANAIIQELHPDKTVFGIDCRNLYEYGGMVHCVTQQQPVADGSIGLNENAKVEIQLAENYPNPFSETTAINFSLSRSANITLDIYNSMGQIVFTQLYPRLASGNHLVTIHAGDFENGVYYCVITSDGQSTGKVRMVVLK